MKKTKQIKTLPDVHFRIGELEKELAIAGVEFPVKPDVRTLVVGREHIAELESRRPRPSAPSPVEPASVTALPKSMVKIPAEVENLVASKLSASGLPSLASIKSELEGKSNLDCVKSLAVHAENYKAKAQAARAKKDYKAETQILRDLQRITNRHAQELYAAGPEAVKAFKRQVPNEL